MNRLEPMVKGLVKTLPVPLTIKMRAGITEGKYIAHTLIPHLRDWGVSMTAVSCHDDVTCPVLQA
jgi:tRNA-dihydrouridine synthase 3